MKDNIYKVSHPGLSGAFRSDSGFPAFIFRSIRWKISSSSQAYRTQLYSNPGMRTISDGRRMK